MITRIFVARICSVPLTVALLMLSVPVASIAQEQMQDVVYLKNGSIIRGDIVEQIPNQTIKIKTSDGSVFVYPMSEIEKITKEQKVGVSAAGPRKPLGSFAAVFNPLGFLQFGPMIHAEFKVGPNVVVGPHLRLLGLGLLTHAIVEYDELKASAMAIGAGARYFFGELDAQDRFVGGLFAEYGFGEGVSRASVYVNGKYVDANYKFSYMAAGSSFGYRWRFNSPFFLGLGLLAGVATETDDYRSSPTRVDYPKKTYIIGMLEFTLGYEK